MYVRAGKRDLTPYISDITIRQRLGAPSRDQKRAAAYSLEMMRHETAGWRGMTQRGRLSSKWRELLYACVCVNDFCLLKLWPQPDKEIWFMQFIPVSLLCVLHRCLNFCTFLPLLHFELNMKPLKGVSFFRQHLTNILKHFYIFFFSQELGMNDFFFFYLSFGEIYSVFPNPSFCFF